MNTATSGSLKATLTKLGDFGPKRAKPDTAVDDRGETITLPTRCKTETFRADGFTLSKDEVHAGDRVRAAVKHLGSEQIYAVEFETGGTLGTMSTDKGGNATAHVTAFKSVKPVRTSFSFSTPMARPPRTLR